MTVKFPIGDYRLIKNMLSEIIKEKTSADHLMYVSLKYTKTCDVILNLIERWRSMIELSFDAILKTALKKKKISELPKSPKDKIIAIKTNFKKHEAIQEALQLYIFFRKVPELNKTRIGDFRKNVALRVEEQNKITEINMDKLKEYYEILERFISEVKHFLSK